MTLELTELSVYSLPKATNAFSSQLDYMEGWPQVLSAKLQESQSTWTRLLHNIYQRSMGHEWEVDLEEESYKIIDKIWDVAKRHLECFFNGNESQQGLAQQMFGFPNEMSLQCLNPEMVESFLLNPVVDINQTIVTASNLGLHQAVRYILFNRINDISKMQLKLALSEAIENNRSSIVKIFFSEQIVSELQISPLDRFVLLGKAAINGHENILNFLIEKGMSDIDERGFEIIIFQAESKGYTDIANILRLEAQKRHRKRCIIL